MQHVRATLVVACRLIVVASLVSGHRLWAHWLQLVVAHGLCCSAACGNLPRRGIEPVSPALAGRLFTTGPPGKSVLHAHGEGELVITLESWETARSSRGVEEGLSRSFLGCGGKPSFPSTSAADLRELPTVPLRGEGCCVVGRASRDSAGFGAMEEGLISRGGRNLRLPLQF